MNRLHTHIALTVLGLLILALSLEGCVRKQNVGIVEISGAIVYQEEANEIIKRLRYAYDRKDIKAVVLEINCPGGEASVIEEIYFTILWLRKTKPVVASVNQIAASGGYYIAVASEWIYAKPTSELGSIGAVGYLPSKEELSEDIATTGPFKSSATSTHKALTHLETLKQSFLAAIVARRGGRLKVSQEELSRAEILVGLEAHEYGLIDAIGPNVDAIEKAARLAEITEYGVVDIKEALVKETPTLEEEKKAPTPEKETGSGTGSLPDQTQPKFHYLVPGGGSISEK